MNLLTDAWLPVRRRSGATLCIRPAHITDDIDGDPIVAPASGRADFDGAILQFMIGLLQTTFAPSTKGQWTRSNKTPPTPAQLDDAWARYRPAFELWGDGPRFMQDLTLSADEGDTKPIRQLLIDAPGENTIKNNADMFVRRQLVNRMSGPSAALALFTLQINAPSGGAGHRTGLRGGGPLTTVVLPHDDALWATCWLNVLPAPIFNSTQHGNPEKVAMGDIFPWMAPTRTSEKGTGRETTALDVHPAQLYWAMPRRIRLTADIDTGRCDLTGEIIAKGSASYVTAARGANYTGAWRHPLTPIQITKTGERISRKMNAGGLSWRHWPGIALRGQNAEPATVVTASQGERNRRAFASERMLAFGYDMDNMKPRCWYAAQMPLIHIDDAHRAAFLARVLSIVEATSYASSALGKQALAALANRGTARGSAFGDSMLGVLWERTEADFYASARGLRDALESGTPTIALMEAWHRRLARVVPALFDDWIDIDHRIQVAPTTVTTARTTLLNHLHGKKMRKALGLPLTSKKGRR